MVDETPMGFLARLRKKDKDKLSLAEETFLKVMDKSKKKAVLGQGNGTKR